MTRLVIICLINYKVRDSCDQNQKKWETCHSHFSFNFIFMGNLKENRDCRMKKREKRLKVMKTLDSSKYLYLCFSYNFAL